MSTTPAPSKAQKSRKEKEKDKEREREKDRKAGSLPTERLKTVVRRLPPNLPEDIFWQTVQPWVTDDTATWKVYYPGKLRKKLNKENIPSRAYIAFKTEEQVHLFSQGYDGHVFRDKTGVESQAVVEFAPYQKVPSEKRKPDTRNATIEKDEDYISFIESLKASENTEPVSLESLIASTQPPPPPKTTPLLEALKAEKSRESIMRAHAHYNQNYNRILKKNAPPPPTPKQAVETPSNGKKSAKKGQAPNGVPASPTRQNGKEGAPSTSKGSANAPPSANSATQSKPTKAAKPPRAPAPSKGANEAKTNKNAEETSRTTAPVAIATPSKPATDAVAPAPATATAPPRRTRPVLGLGSRQFEAALSGVAGLANAASERKRKEKEAQATSPASASANSITNAAPAAAQASANANANFARIDASDSEEKDKPVSSVSTLPTSPRKKTRRGNRGRGNAPADGEGESQQVKVPAILQRADAPPAILQKDARRTPNSVLPAPSTVTASSSVNSANNTRGGGRRGRGGGGRGGPGRGGAPSAPRGG
ncbi:hypothetical protein CPC08DRAFT_699055 [Agrocybe pediades]|nr:hypothetical protein CPC08DRAFT_699055 [Agrocybe pediades]